MKQEFKEGDHVRIKSGPLASFVGRVESVSDEEFRLTVVVEIFGRATPLDLQFGDVDKITPPDGPGKFYSNN